MAETYTKNPDGSFDKSDTVTITSDDLQARHDTLLGFIGAEQANQAALKAASDAKVAAWQAEADSIQALLST